MSFYLLDHPNPNAPVRDNGKRGNYYTTRRAPILAIVVHITAGLEDLDMIGVDDSAEATARYAATTTRTVSWHAGTDSDSTIRLLPDAYTAFHVRGYNSKTLGHEISKRDVTWADEPPTWVDATLRQAAAVDAGWCAAHNIPVRHATRAELDAAIAEYDRTGTARPVGLIGHMQLDPTRRSDPGPDFPWDRYLDLIRQEDNMDVTAPEDVRYFQGILAAEYDPPHEGAGPPYDIGALDGVVGPKTAAAISDWQARRNIAVTGTLTVTTCVTLQSHANRVHATGEARDYAAQTTRAALRGHVQDVSHGSGQHTHDQYALEGDFDQHHHDGRYERTGHGHTATVDLS